MSNQVRDEKDGVELFEDHLKGSEDFFSDVRTAYKEDVDFSNGRMWPDDIRKERESADNKRPCLTINKIDPNVRRIVNEAKQQKLAINVKPVGDDGDPEVAEAHLALIRNVEYQSNAKFAYMWGYECMVRGGFGFWRINTQYEDPMSFNQVARIQRIRNPLSVYWDYDSHEVDGSDAKRVAIVDEISETAAEKLGVRPKESLPTGDRGLIWKNGDGIRVGEMFWVEETPDTLYQLSEQVDPGTLQVLQQLGLGMKFLKSQVNAEFCAVLKARGFIKAERKTTTSKVRWAKFCAGRIVTPNPDAPTEGIQDWNGKYIPVVPVWGRESTTDGKIDFRGITRNSIDPNRMYNYMSSKMVERIALAPLAPWVAAEGQIEPYAKQWKEANVKNIPVLVYKPKAIGGSLAPPPQRTDMASGDPTIERYMNIAAEDVKSTSNLYDASMGAQSNETSGKAILARQAQGNIATYDFIDNVSMSIKHTGRILVDLHCHIVDVPTAVRYLGEDGVEKVIKINQRYHDEDTGKEKFLSLRSSSVDIEVDVGAGDQSRREQAVEKLSNVIGANPQAGALLMDVLVENMDIKNRDKVAKRFKATLPPEVIAAENGDEKDNPELDAFQKHAEGIIMELKGQLQETGAKLQELTVNQKNKDGELALKSRELDIKEQENRAKVELEVLKAQGAQESPDGASDAQALAPIMQAQDAIANEVARQGQQLRHVIEAINKLAELALPGGQEHATPEVSPPAPAIDQGDGTAPVAPEQFVGGPDGGQ